MDAEADTRAWMDRAVLGLGLCPFARAPLEAGAVRVLVTQTEDPPALLAALDAAIDELLASDEAGRPTIETTLLVHPRCLLDFYLFNEFLGAAEARLAERGLEGVLQLASFHPHFEFGDAPAGDPAHATNRSPHPTLHLLREASVTAAIERHPDPDAIWQRNVERLRGLSDSQRRRLRDGPDDEPGAEPAEA